MLSSELDEDEDDFDSERPGCSGLACTEAGCGMYICGISMTPANPGCEEAPADWCLLRFDDFPIAATVPREVRHNG
jgi:hypothetical protein